MGSNLSKVKAKITNGELVVGTSVSSVDPIVSEILSNCGFDFIWIEGEHGTADKKDIDLHIMAVRRAGAAPFVRIPWNDPVLAKPILDMGPAAIIFPFIKTVEEAKRAVSSCKYHPKGIRGFGPLRANTYSTMDNKKYLELAKKEPWVVLQVEHIDAVNNLKGILEVGEVDSIVVGPNDLSGSIGLLGQTRHPKVLKLLDKIADECNKAKIPFGASMGFENENVSDWINRGVDWLALDGDFTYLVNGGKKCIENILNLFKK